MPGNDSNTILLIHSDETDGSTTFTDSGLGTGCPHTIIYGGDIHHEADAAKFGATSIYGDGDGDYLEIADADEFDFGSNPFTIDFWVKRVGDFSGGLGGLISKYHDDSYGEWVIFFDDWYTNHITVGIDGSLYILRSDSALDTNWHHVALVRESVTVLKLYIDGVQQGSTHTDDTTLTATPLNIRVLTAYSNQLSWGFANAYIDEIRISNVARWTGNFTPPASPYNGTTGVEVQAADLIQQSAASGSLMVSSPSPPLSIQSQLSAGSIFSGFTVQPDALSALSGLDAGLRLQVFFADLDLVSDLGASLSGLISAPELQAAGSLDAVSLSFALKNPATLYFFVLTGKADGKEDVTIPISSFQARWKSGDPSYLSVVIPGVEHAAAISARSNGDLVIRMAYVANGEVQIAEEILRATIENIRIDEGGQEKSISLDGHRTVSYESKEITLEGASYRSVSKGKLRYRCAPNIYLRPGDVVTVGGDTFTAGDITMAISVPSKTMEVLEA